MSYNITVWHTLVLDDFRVNASEFNKFSAENYGEIGDQFVGTLRGEMLHFSKVNLRGEGSGWLYANQFKKFLAETSGELVALLIWAEGEELELIRVYNGAIQQLELTPEQIWGNFRSEFKGKENG